MITVGFCNALVVKAAPPGRLGRVWDTHCLTCGRFGSHCTYFLSCTFHFNVTGTASSSSVSISFPDRISLWLRVALDFMSGPRTKKTLCSKLSAGAS